MKVIGFISPDGLDFRGVGVAIYQYAHFNETILGNKSIIYTRMIHSPKTNKDSKEQAVYNKFMKRFEVVFYNDPHNIVPEIETKNITLLYVLNGGDNFFKNYSFPCKTLNHCVFHMNDPIGSTYYAGISDYICSLRKERKYPVLPHIVHLDKPDNVVSMRASLNIPEDAIVFGRYGGIETFNIPFVKEVIKRVLAMKPNYYFIFASTQYFIKHPRVIHVGKLFTDEQKCNFIETCDAMLHARMQGETFGLAIGEFSFMNKPVITYLLSRENQHIRNLGDKGFYYRDAESLLRILLRWNPVEIKNKNWNVMVKYSPENVMKYFESCFIITTPSVLS